MKKWNFTKKIEDMSEEETRGRIREGYEYPMRRLFLMPYLGVEERVTYTTSDFVARCPATGISDVYRLDVIFIPDRHIPELKSLKLYLNEYQELPISHEHLASKIYNDFQMQVKPKKLQIKLEAAIRGGITTVVELGE